MGGRGIGSEPRMWSTEYVSEHARPPESACVVSYPNRQKPAEIPNAVIRSNRSLSLTTRLHRAKYLSNNVVYSGASVHILRRNGRFIGWT